MACSICGESRKSHLPKFLAGHRYTKPVMPEPLRLPEKIREENSSRAAAIAKKERDMRDFYGFFWNVDPSAKLGLGPLRSEHCKRTAMRVRHEDENKVLRRKWRRDYETKRRATL